MKRNPSFVFLSMILLSFCVLSACGKRGSDWGGAISEEAGVVIVKNPIEPKYGPEVFHVEEELSIGESEGNDEYMFQQVRGIAVNAEEMIYVLDSEAKHIKVFDKHGKYMRTFGQAGEGPGEFQAPRMIECSPREEIIVGDLNRITYFDLKGEYKRNLSISRVRLLGLKHDTTGNILGLVIDRENEMYALQKFDKELNLLVSYASSPLPSSGEFRTKRSLYFSVLRWDIMNGKQMACGYAGEGYVIKIFDETGTMIRRIEKEYDPVEVDQTMAEEELKEMPAQVRDSYYAPKYFPPFQAISADDRGRIFVVTYEKTLDEEGYMFDVFDAEGVYITKIQLKNRPRFFKNGRMYTVEENEDGFHVVKRYRIGWNLG